MEKQIMIFIGTDAPIKEPVISGPNFGFLQCARAFSNTIISYQRENFDHFLKFNCSVIDSFIESVTLSNQLNIDRMKSNGFRK